MSVYPTEATEIQIRPTLSLALVNKIDRHHGQCIIAKILNICRGRGGVTDFVFHAILEHRAVMLYGIACSPV
jgi:hypothetical protein